jgi:hypothetical protein
VQDEIVIEYHLLTFLNVTISARYTPSIGNVTAFHIQFLGIVVTRMQSDANAGDSRTPRDFRLRPIEQLGSDASLLERGKHVEILDLRNLQQILDRWAPS